MRTQTGASAPRSNSAGYNLAAARDEVPPELQAAVDGCLSMERDGRYPSGAELAAALVPRGSQVSSTESISPSQRITARSITF